VASDLRTWWRLPAGALLAAATLASAAPGCGYHVVGTDPQLPDDIRSIGVGAIVNETPERGLEKELAFAYEREIHLRGHYRMAESLGEADAQITGRIIGLARRPVAFDENDQAMQYEVTIRLDLALERTESGETLWATSDVVRADEYASNPRVAITSSSEFQRGNLDAADVQRVVDDGIPDTRQIGFIQLAESERRNALRRLLQGVVRDTYNRMIEGF
jgi:hypothetical protein